MWKPGQSGNPSGRPREKVFADMLRLALNDTDADGKRKLRKIAEKLIECSLKGESWALQMIGDRLDGKPHQEATVALSQASVPDLSDDDLLRIAAGSEDTSEEPPSEEVPAGLTH